MPFSALDIVVLGVTVISAVLAAVRGFSREVLGIAGWVVAAAAAWFLHPQLLPFAQQYISHPQIALVATVAVIFIVVLLVMSLITVQISDLILDSRIGAVDRTLGFLFGVARGVLICILGWLLLSMLSSGKTPEWTANAKSLSFLQSSSESIRNTFGGYAEKYFTKKSPTASGSEPPPESIQAPAGTTQ